MRQEYQALNLQVWSLTNADRYAAQSFADGLDEDWLLMAEAEEAFDNYHVWMVPQVFLVDPQGTIVADNLTAADAILKLTMES